MGAISQKGAEFLIRSRLADAEAGNVDAAGRPEHKGQACGQGPQGQAKAAASPWDGS